MIRIVNIGPFNDADKGGWRNYELYINNDLICKFKHKRIDGLATCLLGASDAVKEIEKKEFNSLFEKESSNEQ